jgi:hypothetical protein
LTQFFIFSISSVFCFAISSILAFLSGVAVLDSSNNIFVSSSIFSTRIFHSSITLCTSFQFSKKAFHCFASISSAFLNDSMRILFLFSISIKLFNKSSVFQIDKLNFLKASGHNFIAFILPSNKVIADLFSNSARYL